MAKQRENTAISDLLDSFATGEEFTAGDISYYFGIKNPTATIAYLRGQGYPIYSNKRKTGNRHGLTVYKFGKPRRALLAQGYMILGASVYK